MLLLLLFFTAQPHVRFVSGCDHFLSRRFTGITSINTKMFRFFFLIGSMSLPSNTFATLKGLSLWRLMWLLFCGFMIALWIGEAWTVKTKPEQYAFLWGAEGPVAGLWYYASENIYQLHLAGLVAWFLAGIVLCLNQGPFRRKLLFAHSGLSMLWLAWLLLAHIAA